MQPARPLATYEDLLLLPKGVAGEVVAGTIITLPAPRPRRSKAQRALGGFVGRPFDDDHDAGGPGGWWILIEVDIQLDTHDIVRPDLAGWRRERLPDPDLQPIPVVPDWICEVLSPSNAAHDRVTKRKLYAKHGVRFYWLVDPEARTLEAFELRDGTWVDVGTHDETSAARIPPFDAVDIPIGRLFLPSRQSAEAVTEK